MSKLDSAIAAVCITIIAVSWGGYAKDYLIENQRLEQSRNAVRIMELMQRSGLSPMPFQKPLIEIDPSKAPLESIASSTGRRLTTRRTSTYESHRSSEHENEP